MNDRGWPRLNLSRDERERILWQEHLLGDRGTGRRQRSMVHDGELEYVSRIAGAGIAQQSWSELRVRLAQPIAEQAASSVRGHANEPRIRMIADQQLAAPEDLGIPPIQLSASVLSSAWNVRRSTRIDYAAVQGFSV